MKMTHKLAISFWFVSSFFSAQVFASASPTETVMELFEGTGEIASSSTGDKMEARQVAAEAEYYYAQPHLPLGESLFRQVESMKRAHPELTKEQIIDIVYKQAQEIK